MKYAIVIEKSANGYGGYAPDFPGLGVVGDTRSQVRSLLAEAIGLYLEETERDLQPAPDAEATVEYLELAPSGQT